jgi:hypothetical protein
VRVHTVCTCMHSYARAWTCMIHTNTRVFQGSCGKVCVCWMCPVPYYMPPDPTYTCAHMPHPYFHFSAPLLPTHTESTISSIIPNTGDVFARLLVHLYARAHECTHTPGTRDWELEAVVRESGVEANYEGGIGAVGGGGVAWVEVAQALQEGRDRVRTVSTCIHMHMHMHIHMHTRIYYTYSYTYA